MTTALSTPTESRAVGFHEIDKRLSDYARMSRGAFSANTERAVRSDTAIFTAWCEKLGLSALPADPETVAAFIDDMATTRKPATVNRYLASINHLHRAVDLPEPGPSNAVRLARKRMNRAKGTEQDQAQPLNRPTVDAALSLMGDSDLDLRDAALLSVAYDTFARASELVALRRRDIRRDEHGNCTAFIARSKTDQDGRGQYRFIAHSTYARLMEWVRAWEALSNERMGKNDPLFPPLGFNARNDAISTRDVTEIFKRRCGSDYSAHSTRVGAAQDAKVAGCTTGEIQAAGGWKSERMVSHYTKELAASESAAAKLAAQQGR